MVSGVTCICGGGMSPWLSMPIDAKKNQLTPFSQVFKCSQCGMGSLSPLPGPGDIPAFYELDSYYTHGKSHIREVPATLSDRLLTKLAWWADRSEPFDPAQVAQLLPHDAQICDLGCGHADYLRAFRALGFEVVGVDPDPSAREQAAQAGVPVLEGTAEQVPDLERQFDLVLMTHSLEHCRDPERALANAVSLTKPGGLCYVEVPNCSCEHFRTFTVCSEMFDAPRHIHFFTPASLEAACNRAGFAKIKRLFSGYVRDFGPGWRAWESDIARRVGLKAHTRLASFGLFARSFWRSPERKYDCVGLMLTKPSS